MPPATLARLKSRIGSMGLPRIVWPVYLRDSQNGEIVCFYDREKAEAYAGEHPNRFVGTLPLRIMDA